MAIIVKNTTITNVLDLLAPHSCRGCGQMGNILCECCKNNLISNRINICPHCKTTKTTAKCPFCPNLPPTYIVGKKDDLIGDLIHDYKYHSVRALAKPLAEILHNTLPINQDKTIIVPLPTTNKHVRERGFDHTYLIAKHLAKIRKPTYKVQKLLIRTKDTVQVGSSRHARLSQAESAYDINQKITINPEYTYLLIDDVWTTGASMHASIKKLQQAGAKNIIVAILALS